MTCHMCGANGAYSILRPSCVRCGADYYALPEPCPNCQERHPVVGDECSGCGFTGRCLTCNIDTDFSADPLYCSDDCRRQAAAEQAAM